MTAVDRTEFFRETLPAIGWVVLFLGSMLGSAAGGAWVMTLLDGAQWWVILPAWLGLGAVAAAVSGAVFWRMTR